MEKVWQVASQYQKKSQILLVFPALHMLLSLMTTGWPGPRGGADPQKQGVPNVTWLDDQLTPPPPINWLINELTKHLVFIRCLARHYLFSLQTCSAESKLGPLLQTPPVAGENHHHSLSVFAASAAEGLASEHSSHPSGPSTAAPSMESHPDPSR